MANRLNLDFTLQTTEERTEFVREYITHPKFNVYPLTETELETISTYILWGKDPITGLNARQSKDIQLETRYKTWDTQENESLDALFENPAFNESTLRPLTSPKTKISRESFSRKDARAQAPPEILEKFEQLWQHIDELELIICFYDLAHNKRKTEPRQPLLNRFTEEEIQHIKEFANSLKQYNYLKLRHLIVELRREQFTLRDTYIGHIQPLEPIYSPPMPEGEFDGEILALPFGLKYRDKISQKIFLNNSFPVPQDFSEKELKKVVKEYWARIDQFKQLERFSVRKLYFDFRNPEHIYQTLNLMDFLKEDSIQASALETCPEFLETLEYYISCANLQEIHQDILHLKLRKTLNQKIADYVNEKYGKTYNANYISTIFRQKIIPQINKAATFHELVIQNLCYPENFKKCKRCGQILLKDEYNFVKKAKSLDGFANRCKRCDKELREQNKKRGKLW